MNVFKRLSAVSMIAGLSVLTACGGNSASGNATAANGAATVPAANAAPASSAAPVSNEPVTIEFWYGLGGKLGENMESLIQKFNASQQEVIVKGIVQADYTETEQKLQAAIATGQVPGARALLQYRLGPQRLLRSDG